jgi:beta-lactamase regulating signal transducer with metallopeptidase domain
MTPLAQALNAALLHFVWQGIVMGFFLWLALFLLRRRSANVRYIVSCGALLMLALAPVVTVVVMYEPRTLRSLSWKAAQNFAAAQNMEISATTPTGAWFVFQPLEGWILPVWGLGVALFALRLMWCWGHTSALRRTGTHADETFLVMVSGAAERMGVTRKVRVLMSSLAEVPSVVGWVRPVLLLPVAVATGLTPEQLEALIAHELAHVRRHDYLVNLGQTIVETVLFYHPVVWWASSRIRYERELCCDDLAVETLGDATRYARALARLEEVRILRPSLAMGAAHGPLFHRIERLLGGDSSHHGPSRVACAFGLIIGVACLALNMSWAQERPRTHGATIEDFFASESLATPAMPALPVLSVLSEPPGLPESAAPVLVPLEPKVSPWMYVGRQRLAEEGVPWVLFMGNRVVISGSSADEAEAQSARQAAGGGDTLWFKIQGKAYVTQDRTVLERVAESRGPSENAIETQKFVVQEKNRVADLISEMREREREQAKLTDNLPALRAQDELISMRREVERLRRSLDEMTTKLAQQEALQAFSDGRRGRLQNQQEIELKFREAEAVRQLLQPVPAVLRDAVESGKARPVN